MSCFIELRAAEYLERFVSFAANARGAGKGQAVTVVVITLFRADQPSLLTGRNGKHMPGPHNDQGAGRHNSGKSSMINVHIGQSKNVAKIQHEKERREGIDDNSTRT